MRKSFLTLLAIFGIGIIIFLSGPRPIDDDTITFTEQELGVDLDKYLEDTESDISNIIPGTEKEIIWSSKGKNSVSDIAIVYIHGFSATKHEIRPVPENIAMALDANLYFLRLAGHGRDGKGLAEATMQTWANDFAQAMAIADKIGKKTIILATSTGATLASWAMQKTTLIKKVKGVVFISPNYAIQSISTGLLNMPWANTILPTLMGDTVAWEPYNDLHAKWWTYKYPSKAVFPMAALLKLAREVDYENVKIPALIFYSTKDEVVVPKNTEAIIERWGAQVEVRKIDHSDDPKNHVLAGDIISPSNNDLVTLTSIKWIQRVLRQ